MKYGGKIVYVDLTLRPINGEDIECIRNWRNGDLSRVWFINNERITSQQQKAWYEGYLDKEEEIVFIIEEHKGLNQPIGMVSLYNINTDKKEAEFGRMLIGPEAVRGKGYGLTATKMICKFGFDYYGLKKIYLYVLKENTRAIKTYENAGFNVTEEVERYNKPLLLMVLNHDET